MTEQEIRAKVIKGLECHKRAMYGEIDEHGIACNSCPYKDMESTCHTRTEGRLITDAIALLKEHEKATIEPKRIDLADETKAWLDKLSAVDALRNIAGICMDWDGYRTANGLGELVNEIWAYARYCADRLQKAQEPTKPTTKNGAYFCGNPHCRKIIAQMMPCGAPTYRVKYCNECGSAVKWDG